MDDVRVNNLSLAFYCTHTHMQRQSNTNPIWETFTPSIFAAASNSLSLQHSQCRGGVVWCERKRAHNITQIGDKQTHLHAHTHARTNMQSPTPRRPNTTADARTTWPWWDQRPTPRKIEWDLPPISQSPTSQRVGGVRSDLRR